MNKAFMRRILSAFLCLMLALTVAGCGSSEITETTAPETPRQNGETAITALGTGSKTFVFIAVDLDGNESHFEIHTDAETVGAALMEHQLIAGDQGDYGLYVKTVNGITLDWDRDAKYWSLLIDGEYAMSGVDQTEIAEGTIYTLLPAE